MQLFKSPVLEYRLGMDYSVYNLWITAYILEYGQPCKIGMAVVSYG